MTDDGKVFLGSDSNEGVNAYYKMTSISICQSIAISFQPTRQCESGSGMREHVCMLPLLMGEVFSVSESVNVRF